MQPLRCLGVWPPEWFSRRFNPEPKAYHTANAGWVCSSVGVLMGLVLIGKMQLVPSSLFDGGPLDLTKLWACFALGLGALGVVLALVALVFKVRASFRRLFDREFDQFCLKLKAYLDTLLRSLEASVAVAVYVPYSGPIVVKERNRLGRDLAKRGSRIPETDLVDRIDMRSWALDIDLNVVAVHYWAPNQGDPNLQIIGREKGISVLAIHLCHDHWLIMYVLDEQHFEEVTAFAELYKCKKLVIDWLLANKPTAL